MDQLFLTLHQSALNSKGGITGQAKRLFIRQQTWVNKLNPYDDNNEPKISEFIRSLQDSGDTAPLDAMCRMFDLKAVTRTQTKAESLVQAVLTAGAKHGDSFKSIEEAIADGIIDAKELYLVTQKLREQIHTIEVLINTVKAEHEAKK